MFPRSIHWAMATGSLILASGCAMCCGPYDYDYLATSELLERPDPSHGRAGSVFSDPRAGMVSISPTAQREQPELLPGPRDNSSPLIEPVPRGGSNPGVIQGPTPAPVQPKPTDSPNPRPGQRSVIGATTAGPATPRRIASQTARPLPTGTPSGSGPIRQTGGPVIR